MYTYAITALLAALLSAGAVWRVQDWRYAEKELERQQLEAESRKMREKTVSLASENFEKAKEGERVVYRTIIKTVDRIIERPVYSNVCLDDDGILAINRGKVE